MKRSALLVTGLAGLALVAVGLAIAPAEVAAQPADAGAGVVDAGASDAGPSDAGTDPTVETCVEDIPAGVERPKMVETINGKAWSGYAVDLTLVITHGKGETVAPNGFRLHHETQAGEKLLKAGFVIPEPDAGAGVRITHKDGEVGKTITTLTLPIVPLATKSGRQSLVLPPLPITIARANNQLITLCTIPHSVVVDEPIANELDPKVKPNPPARPQREDWELGRWLAVGIGIGLVVAALLAWLYRWYRKRPKVVPPPPKRLPWLVALEELEAIRRSDLLQGEKTTEYFDRVSDTVRKYLGERYGFDRLQGFAGLETTSQEMRDMLKRVQPRILELPAISDFLAECDLVKFARVLPSAEECQQLLERGESIVRRTIPIVAPAVTGEPEPPPGPAERSS